METVAQILNGIAGTRRNPSYQPSAAETNCPRCQDTGFIAPRHPATSARFGTLETCSCQDRRLAAQKQRYLDRLTNRPDRHPGRKALPLTESAAALAELQASGTGTVVLAAPTAAGKSRALLQAAAPDEQEPRTTIYVDCRHWNTMDQDAQRKVFEESLQAGLAFLDHLEALDDEKTLQDAAELANQRDLRGKGTAMALTTRDSALSERWQELLAEVNPTWIRTSAAASGGPPASGIPEKWRNTLTLESYQASGPSAWLKARAREASASLADKPDHWLGLNGPSGSGKTHLSVGIINAVEQRGIPAVYCFVPETLDRLRYTNNRASGTTFGHEMEKLKTAPLLVLDSLGAETATAWGEEKLHQLLASRDQAGLATVITTTLRQEDLARRYAQMASKLTENRMLHWYPLQEQPE